MLVPFMWHRISIQGTAKGALLLTNVCKNMVHVEKIIIMIRFLVRERESQPLVLLLNGGRFTLIIDVQVLQVQFQVVHFSPFNINGLISLYVFPNPWIFGVFVWQRPFKPKSLNVSVVFQVHHVVMVIIASEV